MTKQDLGLPSDSKAITYQQNREEQLKKELLKLRNQLKIIRNKNRKMKKELT
jgi:hypothetical protein